MDPSVKGEQLRYVYTVPTEYYAALANLNVRDKLNTNPISKALTPKLAIGIALIDMILKTVYNHLDWKGVVVF